MPVMDGLAATRKIKGESCGEQPWVVALTASAMNDDRQAVVESGADAFLAKPCREEEPFETIGSHLSIPYDYDDGSAASRLPSAGTSALSPKASGRYRRNCRNNSAMQPGQETKNSVDQLVARVRETERPNPRRGCRILSPATTTMRSRNCWRKHVDVDRACYQSRQHHGGG